jgi:hypothetical protein
LNVDYYKTNYTNGLEIATDPLNLINSSLEIGYYSMLLSNHVIRLVRFVSKIKTKVVKWFLSLIYI